MLHRFADKRKGGIMDDRLDAFLDEHLVEPVRLCQIGDNEPIGRHGSAMTEDQAVIDPDIVAALQKQMDRVTANITCTAGDEDTHSYSWRLKGKGGRWWEQGGAWWAT